MYLFLPLPSPLLYPFPCPHYPLPYPSYTPAAPNHKPVIMPAPAPVRLTLPTWVSPVSVPASPSSARDNSTKWVLPVSVPASLNPLSPAPDVSPWNLLRVPLTPSPPPFFPLYFLQGFPELCLRRLLAPPCVPPDPYPLIARLHFAYLEYWTQRHPLCHCPLSSSDVSFI